jgi:hypothetical protein
MSFLRSILLCLLAVLLYSCTNEVNSNELPVLSGLNAKIELCSKDKGCGAIILPDGRYVVKENLVIPGNIKFKSDGFTELMLYPNNADTAAIILVAGRDAYAEHIRIEGITFSLQSKAKAILQTNRSTWTWIEDCTFAANNFSDFGIIIGNESSKGAIHSTIVNCSILRCTEAGIKYVNTGNNHHIQSCSIRGNKIGIQGSPKKIDISNTQIEGNELLNIELTSARSVSLTDNYFENGGMVLEVEDYIIFRNNRTSDGKIDVRHTPYIDFVCNTLSGGSLPINAMAITFTGNSLANSRAYDFILDNYCGKENAVIYGNYANGQIFEKCLK